LKLTHILSEIIQENKITNILHWLSQSEIEETWKTSSSGNSYTFDLSKISYKDKPLNGELTFTKYNVSPNSDKGIISYSDLIRNKSNIIQQAYFEPLINTPTLVNIKNKFLKDLTSSKEPLPDEVKDIMKDLQSPKITVVDALTDIKQIVQELPRSISPSDFDKLKKQTLNILTSKNFFQHSKMDLSRDYSCEMLFDKPYENAQNSGVYMWSLDGDIIYVGKAGGVKGLNEPKINYFAQRPTHQIVKDPRGDTHGPATRVRVNGFMCSYLNKGHDISWYTTEITPKTSLFSENQNLPELSSDKEKIAFTEGLLIWYLQKNQGDIILNAKDGDTTFTQYQKDFSIS